MAKTIIGRNLPLYKGDYSTATVYDRFDVVLYDGNSYVSKLPNNQNKPVSNTAYWQLLAKSGEFTEQQLEEFKAEVVAESKQEMDDYTDDKKSELDTYEGAKETELNTYATELKSDFDTNASSKTTTFNQNATEKTTQFNNNASNKTDTFDTNASTKTTTFNENATSKTNAFNTNATNKTTDFNDNASTKTTAFNTNASDKTDAFDSNASDKTDDFNDNATEKTTTFNDNAESKTAEFDEHAQELQQEVEELSENMPWNTVEATEISVDDAAKYSRNKLELFGNTEQKFVLPVGYTAVEYIRGNGNQWIDTEYKPNNNTKIEVLGQNFKLGTDSSWYTKSFDIAGSPFSFGNTGGNITLTGNKELLTMENGKIKSSTDQRTFNLQNFQCEYNLVLFAINRNDNIIEKSNNCKIYSCKLWENNTLVRDFIPCRNPNNEIGLYDMVSQTFFANQGKGSFAAGEEITKSIHIFTGKNTIHINNTDYPLSLGNMEFGKIGESQDKFFKNEPNNPHYDSSLVENGWYKNEIIKKLLFKNAPNESWAVWNTNIHEYQIRTDIQDSRANGTWVSALCDKFKNVSVAGNLMKDNEFSAFSGRLSGDINYLYFRFKKDPIDNLNDFKTFVENNNLLIYVVLDKPVPTQITDPILTTQLDEIYGNLKLVKGTNNITVTAEDLAPNMQLTYMQDTNILKEKDKQELENIKSRLSLLE